MTLHVEVADEQAINPVSEVLVSRFIEAARLIANDHGFFEGEVSIAVLDDAAIHRINREYLDHDWPTDVITFPFEAEDADRSVGVLDGEIVVSRETADRVAQGMAWAADDELLLYVVHGMLHLVGFDDIADEDRKKMRAKEREYLLRLQVPFAEQHDDQC